MLFSFLAFCLLSVNAVLAFSSERNDNLAVYWGQDGAGHQQRLSFYCDDDTINVFPLAFLYTFFGKGGLPVLDFANICSSGSGNFPGTDLANCAFMAPDIQKCQAKGKLVTLSLGGATANVGFNSASQAASFAQTIWDMFLGGHGAIRPFGTAVLDGVDLDIENGSAAHYDTFVNTIRSLSKGAKKRFYVTAAPQCPFPDAKVGQALNAAPFDAVYVQFYNNFCETSSPSEFNFATWDHWAKTQSPNKDVKVYLGAPGSAAAAGSGFVSSGNLIAVAKDAQKKYSSFGGIMLWDADTAFSNNKYHASVKNAIRTPGGPTSDPSPSNPNPATTSAPALPPSATHVPPPATSTKVTTKKVTTTKKTTAHPTSTALPVVASPARDPLATARVKRPANFTFDKRAAPEARTPFLKHSRFFKF